jgi:branched-chain amino acid transport system substrate-binding protein
MHPFRCPVLLWVAGLCLAGCSARGTSEPILVGHVGPLSGPEKTRGVSAQRGIDLGVEETNQDDHRIAGRTVTVKHADSGDKPDAAQSQTVRLLTIDKVVALLGDSDPAELDRVIRAAQPYSVPLVTPGTLPPGSVNDYVFSATIGPADQGQALARFAAEELKPTGVTVLIDSRNAVAAALADAFRQEAGKRNVAVSERTYKDPADFAGLAGDLKKAAPRVVLLAGASRDLLKLRAQVHEAVPEAALLLGTEEGGLVTLAEDRTTGGAAYLASAFAPEGLTPAGQELARKYRDRFGQDLDPVAGLAYDAARILFEGMRNKESATGAKQVRAALAGLENFDSLTGPLSMTKEHTARRAVFVVRLEEGTAKLVRRSEPEAK